MGYLHGPHPSLKWGAVSFNLALVYWVNKATKQQATMKATAMHSWAPDPPLILAREQQVNTMSNNNLCHEQYNLNNLQCLESMGSNASDDVTMISDGNMMCKVAPLALRGVARPICQMRWGWGSVLDYFSVKARSHLNAASRRTTRLVLSVPACVSMPAQSKHYPFICMIMCNSVTRFN